MNGTYLIAVILFVLAIANSCARESRITMKKRKEFSIRYLIDTSHNQLVIYTTGMPDVQYQEASLFVAKKYGFTYFPIAGCVVSESAIVEEFRNNDSVYKILNQIHGNRWRQNFNREKDDLQQVISKAKELYYNSPFYAYFHRFDNHYGVWIDFTPHSSDKDKVVCRALCLRAEVGKYGMVETDKSYTIDVQKQNYYLSDSVGKIELVIDNRH